MNAETKAIEERIIEHRMAAMDEDLEPGPFQLTAAEMETLRGGLEWRSVGVGDWPLHILRLHGVTLEVVG